MKNIVFIICFLLSGCYLANGSPHPNNYWIKNGKKMSIEDDNRCSSKVYPNLGERYISLSKKQDKLGWTEFYKNQTEYKEFYSYLEIASKLMSKCYYDLGYRFKAPLYWCLAQDGDNTRVCMENMKYRN
ncbi:hypothetical protein QV08_10600 [Gallibacterium salpingitidis]|uniref:Lipoprotein n=1 Tax=Gallibacterium salpingitidis TaxID=505341 RepID=A0AB36E194_9PAST|nr:hypothetical protein [Gallibacterium salpingitidis]OBX06307.1 hypothetical protein QV08_10600 [Gallibacterium salpingitidis]OBX09307.1 hypothetical protein QV09_08395 [Gallibacterium salpingitidis]